MKLFNKIQALTLTEIMVVLALTAIVAALSFSVLGFTTKSMTVVSKNYQVTNNIRLLESRLTQDFANFNTLNYNARSQVLQLANPITKLNYTITDSYIIRAKDTLFTGDLSVQYLNAGTPVQQGITDAIKVAIKIQSKTHMLFINAPTDGAKIMQAWE